MKKMAVVLFIWLVSFTGKVEAINNQKYATLVNPIRNRELWKDKSLKPIEDQYTAIGKLGLKATWLIQDDVTHDSELVNKIKSFNQEQELGVFLEISKSLAEKARVYYPTETEWYSPKAVFLSAYKPSERKRLIDTMMADFKNTFGFLPKSAGAWWIDSYSQQYLENKYQIKTVMIVADQKTTDNYGVWGQWWGYPYHPSPNNILVPGNSKMVVIQWAQRDWEKAFNGEGKQTSNYSLQANDYTSMGLNINYFEKLASQYLSIDKLGQITVGLETGMESVGQEKEYEKQLQWLADNKVQSVTMSEFSDVYGSNNPGKVLMGNWVLTPSYRENKALGERTDYNPEISFGDKFMADKSGFLNRVLPKITERKEIKYWPVFLILIPILWWWGKNMSPVLWTIVLFLPIFSSYYESGWKVFFGPVLNNLILGQVLVIGIGGVLISLIYKKLKLDWSSWWAVWIINLLVFTARYSVIDGKKYLGWLVDNFRFIGVGGTKLVNQDLPGQIAATMLKFNPDWIWGRWWIWTIIYPLVEIGLVVIIGKILPKKLRIILAVLGVGFIYYLLKLDPVAIK